MSYFDIDLELTEEDVALQEAAHRFAKEVIRPVAKKLDAMSAEAYVAKGSPFWDFMKQAYQLGCRIASLEVRISNEKAIELYKTFGFKSVAIRKNYYQNEDALVMMSDIIPEGPC